MINLRDAFSNAAKSFGEKELKEKDIEDILISTRDFSFRVRCCLSEVIDSIKSDLERKADWNQSQQTSEIEKFVKDSLSSKHFKHYLMMQDRFDLFANIRC